MPRVIVTQRRERYINYVLYGLISLRKDSRQNVPHRYFTKSEIFEAAKQQMQATGQSGGTQASLRLEEGLAQMELNVFIERRDEGPEDIESSFRFTQTGANTFDGLLSLGNTQPEPANGGSSRPQREVVKKRVAGAAKKKSRVLAAGINAIRRKHFIRTSGFQKYSLASVNTQLQREKKKSTLQAARLARTPSFTNSNLSRAGSVVNIGVSTNDGASIAQGPRTPIRRRLTAQGSILAQGAPPTPGPEPQPQDDVMSDAMDVDVDVQDPETVDMNATPVPPQRSIDPVMAYPSPASIQRPQAGNTDIDTQAGSSNAAEVQETPSRAARSIVDQSTSFLSPFSWWRRFNGGGSGGSTLLDVNEANKKVNELECSLKEAQARLEAAISVNSAKEGDISTLRHERTELQRQLDEVKRELDDVKRELSDATAKLEGLRYENLEQARAIERLETIERTMGTIARAIVANPNTMQMVEESH
ncbi:hypothetical protein EST38_g4177 [Candolleomyces aberdarensis]|uniref:Uncharacterized protein n=1 Tax=Candolleomyces aberdarensis TaxID=2316362 RepID=A0A4Q2DNP8_9AGAR|nr:hypothetical protein EST38_g4177 [Candolleomyces aberdarensis]